MFINEKSKYYEKDRKYPFLNFEQHPEGSRFNPKCADDYIDPPLT